MKRIIIISVVLFMLIFLVIASMGAASLTNQPATQWKDYTYPAHPLPQDWVVAYSADASLTASNLSQVDGNENAALINERSVAIFTFDIPEAGRYRLYAGYRLESAGGREVEFQVRSGESPPFTGTLCRAWIGSNPVLQSASGNDIRPQQTELLQWTENTVKDTGNLMADAVFELGAGSHTITISEADVPFFLSYLMLRPVSETTYATYIHEQPGETEPAVGMEVIQAENMYRKSSSAIYPSFDRTSPLVQPYHPTQMRLNTVGGGNWYESGQWASWIIDVPEDGWYRLGLRYKQSYAKGFFSARTLRIDGEIPFVEADGMRFSYSVDWKNQLLKGNNGEPFRFYLTAGEHEIALESTLGELAPLYEEFQETLYSLNGIYREIIMVTGTMPDSIRDYELYKNIPGLRASFEAVLAQLQSYESALVALSSDSGLNTSIIHELIVQIESFLESDYTIPRRLSTFSGNVSAFGDWIFEITQQPLELDYLYLASIGQKPPAADAGFLQQASHEVASFLGSFTQNYDSIGGTVGQSNRKVTVWVGTGRDQAYVIRRMIDEKFTPESGITVELNLVQGALLRAVISGAGPDISLLSRRGEVMNMAFRGALLPVDEMPGFEQRKADYMPSAFLPYEYQGHVYGMPSNQSFFMMFTRDDILSQLEIEAPATWEEVMEIAPVLQNRNLEIGLPYRNLDAYALLNNGVGALNLFPTLLCQNGGGMYNAGHTATRLDEPVANAAFKQWTDFYTLYDYTLYKNDFNRFRTGEMPIVISEYTEMYNYMAGAAPELAGSWSMHPIPGTLREDGSIDFTSCANGSADLITRDCRDTEAAYTFLEWWSRPEIQAEYARDLEAEMSVLGRFTPANVEAFKQTNWNHAEQEVMLRQWERVEEIPEIPGGYFIIRNLDNAFREVYYDNGKPLEALFYWNKSINNEIATKRDEFGLDASS